MAETKKKTPSKTSVADAKQGAKKAAAAAEQVFTKLKGHFEPKKVDDWQKKWLAVPANRKKYEKLSDAPEVAGSEMKAMANDIIDFVQGEEGGKSEVFRKLKSSTGAFFKHPISFLQEKAAKGKEMAKKVKGGAGSAKKKSTGASKK